ncbi:MAG TPA: hypothetical protein VGL71_09210, partial [Urbifossiella sp.]
MTRISEPLLKEAPRELARREGGICRGEQVFELRDDVRRSIPLALTPQGREQFLHWFIVLGGQRETGATLADLLAYLFEQDSLPDRGLAASYRVHPDWQKRWPNALTSAGWDSFKCGLAAEFGITERWLGDASLPPDHELPADSSELGANVLGLFRHTSGLQQNAVAVVGALAEAGVKLSLRDIPMAFHRDPRRRRGFDGLERYPVTLLDIGLDMTAAEVYRRAGLYQREDRYRIAVWSWELEQLPEEWHDRAEGFDEVWAPTEFIAAAVRP